MDMPGEQVAEELPSSAAAAVLAEETSTSDPDVADDDGSGAHDISGGDSNRKDELYISDLTEAERFITFSDAVIAIAMTLLILPLMEATSDIVVEDGEQIITVQQFFSENADKVGAFFISFWLKLSSLYLAALVCSVVSHSSTIMSSWCGGSCFSSSMRCSIWASSIVLRWPATSSMLMTRWLVVGRKM